MKLLRGFTSFILYWILDLLEISFVVYSEPDMKNLFVYLKKYKKESILAPLFKLLEALFDLLVPIVVARMINTNASSDKTQIFLCFGLLLLMAAIGLACSTVAQFFSAKASTSIAGDLRQELFDHIQKFSHTELDTLGSDTLITRLSADINQVQTGINMGLRLLLRSPFIVFGAMVMAFTIDVRCAIVFAITIPILLAVTLFIMKVSIPLFSKAQTGLDKVTSLTRENLTGVRVIRAFCREEQSVEEFEESNNALTQLNLFVGRISAVLNPLTYVLINLATIILIKQAAIQVSLGSLQQGSVVALYNYMLQIVVELIKLASLTITINKALACSKRVFSVMDIKPSMEYETSPCKAEPASDVAVEFKNVSFTYSGAGAPSLNNISFCAVKGQTVGIIGGTGSGKSTLVNLIPRFYDATSGSVLLNGKNVKQLSKEEICNSVGVVPQKAVLFQGTIRDNLKWGNANASDEELWQALSIAQAKEIVEKKPGELDFAVEQNGKNLSGGQKQRLTIARALTKKAPILILDDSSSALDFATDVALRKALRNLEGTTTFLVSQRIACVRQADTILVINNGNLVGMGNHETLMTTCTVYQDIYYSQFPEEKSEAQK